MTLATRCSACGTSFRVVQDQLKVSGGWVRCGRCNEVFNAIEGLYEIGSPTAERSAEAQVGRDDGFFESALAPSAAPPPPATEPDGSTRLPGLDEPWSTPQSATSIDAHGDAGTAAPTEFAAPGVQVIGTSRESSPAGASETPSDAAGDSLTVARGDADAASAGDPDAPQARPPAEARETRETTETPDAADPPPIDEPTPSFVRAAQRAERWRQPAVQRRLGAAAGVLTVTLVLQAGLAYRDLVAARWPALRAPLAQVCNWVGCRIEPPRHLAALTVESSGLQQLGSTTIYNLSFALRNRGDTEVLLPALDLVLSDTQGKTIVRRVLTMRELGHAPPTLDAGGEIALQAGLNTGDQRVAGYTIEIFYP